MTRRRLGPLVPRLLPFVKGLVTLVPGAYRLICLLRPPEPDGTFSARYCYSVWLRHLVLAHACGLARHPERVGELGPGNSLGVGLAALLTGAREYCTFDVVRLATEERNLVVLDELVGLLRRREPVPDERELPEVLPRLPSYGFPHDLLDDESLERALQPARVAAIRRALRAPDSVAGHGIRVSYVVPWDRTDLVGAGALDMIFSQATLEHVDDLEGAYRAMTRWLRPGGVMTHTIDFRAHETTPDWNGHWAYNDLEWAIVRGRRPYWLNRQPWAAHRALLRANGLQVAREARCEAGPGIGRARLGPRFRHMSDEDLCLAGVFVVATKPR